MQTGPPCPNARPLAPQDPHTQSEGHLSNGFDAALLSKRLAKRGGPGAKAAKRAELRDAPKPKGKAAAKPKVARTWNDPSGGLTRGEGSLRARIGPPPRDVLASCALR